MPALLAGLLLAACAPAPDTIETLACREAGAWIDPATGAPLAPDRLMEDLAERDVVLLGETHDRKDHHRWQTQVLAALHGIRPRPTVGFEMLPRSSQEALDAWTKGELTMAAFLEASRWEEVWGYDPELYFPLLHFVQRNRLPAVALNVDRALVSRVAREGWHAVPAEAREGVSDPAPLSESYRRYLAKVFVNKHGHGGEATEAIDETLEDEGFARFTEAQATWDRAMAEALADAHREDPVTLLVGIAGRGHLEQGFGIPWQLADLGIGEVAVLLPLDVSKACDELAPGLADAVFIL